MGDSRRNLAGNRWNGKGKQNYLHRVRFCQLVMYQLLVNYDTVFAVILDV